MIFDYVVATPQETSRSMHRSSLKYDLSSHEEREEALVLLHRQQRQGDHVEFWMNIKIDKNEVPHNNLLDDEWIMPETGTLSFEVVFFPKNDPIREEVFVVILEQLEQQLSTKEAMEHLIYICTDACVDVRYNGDGML